MPNPLTEWIDDRIGAPSRFHRSRERTVPGGASCRYVSGPALAAVFLVQAFTGLMMMTSYSPSSATAWGSVDYISFEMWLGWIIRGMHHYAAQAMVTLLAFYPSISPVVARSSVPS